MAGTLTKRILTAAILAPAVLVLVVYGNSHLVALGFGLLAMGCAWEWSGLSVWKPASRLGYTISVGLLLCALSLMPDLAHLWIIVGGVWWCFSAVLVFRYQVRPHHRHWLNSAPVHTVIGWMMVIPAWAALVHLHQQPDIGRTGLVIICLLVWGADTGAYFIGRAFGKHKLSSNVSPGKTWEGVGGALLMGLVLGWVGTWLLRIDLGSVLLFVLLCEITIAMSVVGDLTESLFKRQSGVKDSGRLLPGHGGLLDRVDGLIAAAPVFFLGLGVIL